MAVWDEPPRVGVREIDRRGKGVPHDAGQGKNQGAAAQTGQEARDQGPVEDEQGRAQSSRRPSQLAARSTFQAKAITRGLVQNGPSASFCLLPSAFRRRTEFRLSALRTVEEELGRLIEIVAVVRAPGAPRPQAATRPRIRHTSSGGTAARLDERVPRSLQGAETLVHSGSRGLEDSSRVPLGSGSSITTSRGKGEP